MTIWEIYEFVNFELNKFQSGSYTPDEFNQVLFATYLDPLKIKLGLPEEYQLPIRGNSGGVARQEYQISTTVTDAIRTLIRTTTINKVNNFFPYPADYVGYSGAEYDMITNVNGGQPLVQTQSIEPVTDAEKKFRQNNSIVAPDSGYPIITLEDGGFLINPANINSFRLTYVRAPQVPFLGYTLDAQGNVIYDPTTSVQLEYPIIMHNDYCAIILKYIGLNIRDADPIQFGQERQLKGQ